MADEMSYSPSPESQLKKWTYKKKDDPMKTFSEYDLVRAQYEVYPDAGNGNIYYPTLALCGETGEIAEKVKKIIRDEGGELTEHSRSEIVKELGDVLWYVSALARELGFSLETVARANIAKLEDRRVRGQLHGSGDNR